MPPAFDFDAVDLDALRRRRSEKWTRYPQDVLPAHIAEMDFTLAPPVAGALHEAIEAGDVGYAHARRSGLPEAFAEFAARRWQWEVDPETVVAVPDVMVGVAELLRLLTRPGAGVVVNTPVYPPFFSVIAETGRTVVEVPLLEPGADARLPLEGIGAALASGAEAVLLCNPQNPTGYVAREEELLELAGLVQRYEALLLSDEIHAPLTLPGVAHVPFCSLPADGTGRAISLTSASKAWNLAGLKCGLRSRRRSRCARRWRRCRSTSTTGSGTSASSRPSPRTPRARHGSTSCAPTSPRRTAASPNSWPTTCPESPASPRRRPTSPGSTAAAWTSATTRQRSS
jgi:cysteine-S-conjugate beta-lyase